MECDQSCDHHVTKPLTKDEWQAIVTLRSVANIALAGGDVPIGRNILALPGRVRDAVDVADGLLRRTASMDLRGRLQMPPPEKQAAGPADSDLVDDPDVWLVWFEDPDRSLRIFSGCGATKGGTQMVRHDEAGMVLPPVQAGGPRLSPGRAELNITPDGGGIVWTDGEPIDESDDDTCPNCGGVGMVAGCFEDTCTGADCDPEDAENCCMPRRCDWRDGKVL